jgi:hypothetical protein
MGGTKPDGLFPANIDTNIVPGNISVLPSEGVYSLAALNDPSDPDYDVRHLTPDFEYHVDLDSDDIIDADDIQADVWMTNTGINPAAPRIGGSGPKYSYIMYEIRARGRSAGNAEIRTTADFRVLWSSPGG